MLVGLITFYDASTDRHRGRVRIIQLNRPMRHYVVLDSLFKNKMNLDFLRCGVIGLTFRSDKAAT